MATPIPIVGLGILAILGVYLFVKADKVDNLLFGKSDAAEAERKAKNQRDNAAADTRNNKGAVGNTFDFFGGEGYHARQQQLETNIATSFSRGLGLIGQGIYKFFTPKAVGNTRNITRDIGRLA